MRRGCSWSLILTPCLRNSPARTSNSNVPKRMIVELADSFCIGTGPLPLVLLES